MSQKSQLPTIAILIDATKSMTLKDNNGKRDSLVNHFLKSSAFGKFPQNVELKYYTFSVKPHLVNSIINDSIAFSGDETDISSVLSLLKDSIISQNVSTVVLLSDGIYTTGKNPVYQAEEMSVPFFTVGVGDTSEQRDLIVTRAESNKITYAETKTPVDIRIKSSGYGGENVEIELTEGSKVLDKSILTIVNGTREYPIRLNYLPEKEGSHKLNVRISKLQGEFTENNNYRSFFIKVLRNKLKVVLIAGSPDPDLPVIRQSLIENKNFNVNALIQKSENRFYDEPNINNLIDSADCFISIGFPTASTSQQFIEKISGTIEQRRVPLLFINSKNIDYVKLKYLSAYLPFSWSGVQKEELLVRGVVPEKSRNNSIINLNDKNELDLWNRMPPIYKSRTIFKLKPEADILFAASYQNLPADEPLLASRNINRYKTIALTGYGVWRWQLLMQNDEDARSAFARFINNSVKWLTAVGENKKVIVKPVKEFFTTSEPVEFVAEVYNDRLEPVENATLSLSIKKDNYSSELSLKSIGNGRYEGFFENLTEGDYSFNGTAKDDDLVLGSDNGKISVGQINAEFIDTKMNKYLLEKIAQRTGGAYLNINEAEKLPEDIFGKIKFEAKEITHTTEVEMWNWKYLGVIIIILFAVEWFVRKRKGMI
ncbi:MAG: VWA domain-containing protein [Ignavibacteriales bacterium]|nr:VWA domain-containing protein [Ignavibacteriales bacterium]